MIEKEEEEARRRRRWPVVFAAGLAGLAALAIGGWRWLGPKPGAPQAEPPPLLKSAPPPPPAAPANLPEAAEVVSIAPAAGIPGLRLELEATDRVAITVSADGRSSWNAVMRRGGRRVIQAAASIQLEVNNAGGVAATVNGESRGPLGDGGQKRTVTFTLQGPAPGGPRQ
jgi:hypothetical protein